MASLIELQRKFAEQRAQGDAASSEARELWLRAALLKTRLEDVERASSEPGTAREEVARLSREIDRLNSEAGNRRSDAIAAREGLDRTAVELLDIPLDDRIGQLDDHVPFLLFPVRLETKFAHGPDGVRLRVRIFPDEILISTHDPLLTSNERADGVNYWSERARALDLDADERRTVELAAWSQLATRFGGPRARYVARQTKPEPWPPIAAPATAASPSPVGEDEGMPTRLSYAAAPARARLLPDHFVIVALDQDNQVVAQQAGRPIPDTLALGPDPEAPVAELMRDPNGRLAADPKLEWLFDYERAVDVGMAVTLPVDEQFVRTGFSRVIAIGVKASLDAEAGAAALEDLLSDHRYTSGIDILQQGSPTNNTEGAKSAFTSDLSADEALADQEVANIMATGVLDHAGKSDIQRLAEALGVNFDSLRDWPTASKARDISDALAMNRALWPATFGNFLRELVGNRMTDTLKTEIQRFFQTYVTGRSMLPAIRVGSQPYGILATSDLSSWLEAPVLDTAGHSDTSMLSIAEGLGWFRRHFESIAERPDPALAQLGKGPDSVAMTLRVIGQLASSASFASRKAVTDEWAWNTLHYQHVTQGERETWWADRKASRDQQLAQLGIDPSGLPIADLMFFDAIDPLAVPVVDRDPDVPLSEQDGLSKFDNSRNYIEWLLAASQDELMRESFTNESGDAIPPPRALLYRLLHSAWTTQLSNSAADLFARVRPQLVASPEFPSLVNVGAQKVVHETHSIQFDASKLGLTQTSRGLGDLLLDFASSPGLGEPPPEALPLQSHREALSRLADRPTAVLERLFAEHVDLAGHRLDAWQTGLVSRRLDHMRRREGRGRGVYLGAYGYVEDLVPKPTPQEVDQGILPENLRGPEPVVEVGGNGGFVHAPSLNHAATAAVLLNAYLTHAEPTNREVMSVNLTSQRVRAAMSFIEGVHAGQDLAALLGYQFERGLHENHPSVELDQYIYVLRGRFPLVSRRLTPVPATAPSETIEARNVVDGYDLIQQVRQNGPYPHGITGLPPAGAEADAIKAEVERLEETLDAIADLILAESVHQAVQSNMDRARGVVGAISDGELLPAPDIALTPRSGRVITERVALHLPETDDSDGHSSVRAKGNPRLNAWLVAQLPAPHTIGLEVRAAGAGAQVMTLDQSGLDAIDIVLMSGDRFGDGSSQLERYLADRWRGSNNIGDDVVTLFGEASPGAEDKSVVFDAGAAVGATPLGTLIPHLRALRRTIAASAGLNAEHYRPQIDVDKADSSNPKGYKLDATGDLDVLPSRVRSAHQALGNAASALEQQLVAVANDYEALRENVAAFDGTAWSVPLDALRTRLREIALFGLAEAVPTSAAGIEARTALRLFEQGRAVLATVRKRLDHSGELLAPLQVEPALSDPAEEARRLAGRLERRFGNLREAVRLVLGAGFPLQPVFRLAGDARAEIESRLADPIENDPVAIETWLQSLARVRPRMADAAFLCAAAQWGKGTEPRAVPVQLPFRAGDPWIGLPWTGAPKEGEVMTVMTLDAPATMDADQEGLLIDEWTETVPTDKETTGLAFHFDRPNASAPQALLLAVPPNPDGRWHWSELQGVIVDTFAQARLRAVEPDLVNASPLFPIVPATLAPFFHGDVFTSTFFARDAANITLGTG
jgi:hypothetical protein